MRNFLILSILALLGADQAANGACVAPTQAAPKTFAEVKAKWIARLEAEECALFEELGIPINGVKMFRKLSAEYADPDEMHLVALKLPFKDHNSEDYLFINEQCACGKEQKTCDLTGLIEFTLEDKIQAKKILARILSPAQLSKLKLVKGENLEQNGEPCFGWANSTNLRELIIAVDSRLRSKALEGVLLHEAVHIKNYDHQICYFSGTSLCEKRADIMAVLEHSDPLWCITSLAGTTKSPYEYRGGAEWLELYHDCYQFCISDSFASEDDHVTIIEEVAD